MKVKNNVLDFLYFVPVYSFKKMDGYFKMPCFIDEKIFNDLLTFFIFYILLNRVFGENETFMIINNLNERPINQRHLLFRSTFFLVFSFILQ